MGHIDSIRGFAALLVLFTHTTEAFIKIPAVAIHGTLLYDIGFRLDFGNIPMLYSVFNVEPLLGLFWTLEVELVFYFFCLTLFLCGWLDQPVKLFVVGLIMMAIH
jgi:peptidoglycan/LPS O-acetylase OafA/YrhL